MKNYIYIKNQQVAYIKQGKYKKTEKGIQKGKKKQQQNKEVEENVNSD